ncbi:MAG: DUF6152 family protein [Steroidobacteraceae bacterium]
MEGMRIAVAAGALALAAGGAPAMAHHSFAAFDLQKTVTVDGVLTEVKFTNPHSWMQVEVTGQDGKAVRWGIEGLSPGQYFKKGLKRSQLKVGDHVKVIVNPLRSGEPGGSLVKATLADGSTIEGGPGQ